jgi:hypothetical protein
METQTEIDIRYIHDTELGCTFAYTIMGTTLLGTFAFCAKPGYAYPRPQGKRPDQFSRKTGRAITSARIKQFFSHTDRPNSNPYQVIARNIPNNLQVMRRVENTVRNALLLIKDVHPGYFYRNAPRMEQFENTHVHSIVSRSLMSLSIEYRDAARTKVNAEA